MFDITIEQAKALEAVVRLGTIQKAATELNKGHSAILYSLKNLEEQLKVKLFDRSGHRNKISLEGEMVLKYCRKILDTQRELVETCKKMNEGWEPSLKIIYDEIVDFNFIGDALSKLSQKNAPIEMRVQSAHLHEVEALFSDEEADIMVTILPLQKLQIPSLQLAPIHMHLVAHHKHPLCDPHLKHLTSEQLNEYTFITIKSAPTQVGLSTERMKFDSYFLVNGFFTKKAAIMKQLGFGWLPDYLIQKELKKGELKLLKTQIDHSHTVFPRLYHRPEEKIGKSTRELLTLFKK
ncbi:MAG: LysR family transcriptional regulator [Bdellovibrionaceae bacterium]|nr:LysR family transcriptional regulator [Pseudobdellovibrionaceae bacterium]